MKMKHAVISALLMISLRRLRVNFQQGTANDFPELSTLDMALTTGCWCSLLSLILASKLSKQ
jgi:hypothetical protein